MRLLNAIAWAGIACMIAVAFAVAQLLGFLGLFLVGGLAWLVCTRAALDSDVPTWGRDAFAARMAQAGSPEQRAARQAERASALQPLRYYGRCAMALALIGAAGFAWQVWPARQ